MRRVVVVRSTGKGGFTLNNGGEKPYLDEYEGIQDAIGAVVLNFLDGCGGNTCTVTIEGPDKKEEKDKP